MAELTQAIDIEEEKTSDEKLKDLQNEIRLLKETLRSQKEVNEKLGDFENEIRLLKEILCSQKEIDQDLLIGRDIVKNARNMNSADFPDIAMEMFGYYALSDLTENLGLKFIQAKRRLLIHDQDDIKQTNVQNFYTNFLLLLLEERFPDFFERDHKENFQPAAFQGTNSKTFFPDLVIGFYGFRSKGRIEETFTRCPKEIVGFKQRLLQERKDEGCESIYHQFGTCMARCISNYGHLDPPKYLVGALLDFDGAEVFIVETKAIKKRKALKKNIIQVSFEWDLKSIEGIARGNQRRDEEIDETSEMTSQKKRTKTSELKADLAEAFYMLFDFIYFILHPIEEHIVSRG